MLTSNNVIIFCIEQEIAECLNASLFDTWPTKAYVSLNTDYKTASFTKPVTLSEERVKVSSC